MSKETNIRVICRFRPINKLEMSMGGETCVDLDDRNVTLSVDRLLPRSMSQARGMRTDLPSMK